MRYYGEHLNPELQNTAATPCVSPKRFTAGLIAYVPASDLPDELGKKRKELSLPSPT
jgi:hypothetical protein